MPMDLDQEFSTQGPQRPDSPRREEIIVRADEVDEAGADISEITSTDDKELEARVEARREQERQNAASPRALANAVEGAIEAPPRRAGASLPPGRPILRREASAPPPPPRQPPPPAPPAQHNESQGPSDSLSLAQLRNIVTNLPKLEPTAYAYTYEDTRIFPEELEEWFQYTEEDRGLLIEAKQEFQEKLGLFRFHTSVVREGRKWTKLPAEAQEQFLQHQLRGLEEEDAGPTAQNLECLAYIAMGVWQETTDEPPAPDRSEAQEFEAPNNKYLRTVGQLNCIKESAQLLCRLGGLQVLYDVVRGICDTELAYNGPPAGYRPLTEIERSTMAFIRDRQLNAALTILYFTVESGRQQLKKGEDASIRQAFVALEPQLLHYLTQLIARLRWEDASNIPFTKVLLLSWKTLLLVFGTSKELDRSKEALQTDSGPDKKKQETILTASPLDYHVFRQEITSKYPAYNPPPPLVPLEINNNSILPPLPNHPSRTTSHDNLQGLGTTINGASKSIFHQPVHISTPAPSPPPSPAGPGGKGGKKQNYQTNQNFPFLYPPLDSSSNDLGGKGGAGLQDRLVGKKWKGSDIPASILEAAQLFASRMRMSRALRQLWEVREDFIKFERGWEGEKKKKPDDDDIYGVEDEPNLEEDLEKLNLDDDDNSSIEEDSDEESEDSKRAEDVPFKPKKETDDPFVQERLDAVEGFYRNSLPHLQSIVIVLLKILLSNVTVLGNQSGPNGVKSVMNLHDLINTRGSLPKANLNLSRQLTGMTSTQRADDGEKVDRVLEDLNAIRTREITSKAISGFLLMVLKWFRLSHVLKFEYLTQLLLDSNYLPLALKYFAMQDPDKAVDLKHDRADLDFFRFCYLNAGHAPTPPPTPLAPTSLNSSPDEAQPPPILQQRPSSLIPSPRDSPSPPRRPEVDELGYPTNPLPSTPLTTYAPRFFYTHITTLRILQKLTKSHAHRALLLVQYKSSTILRKGLKIPQPDLRLYTLKLFKSQVPYCGRKWRQGNMRVITAIYVFCRMGLRDEWISGGGMVDEWVDGALGLERAWRGLVGWWHGRGYRDVVTLGPRGTRGTSAEGDDDSDEGAAEVASEAANSDDSEDEEARNKRKTEKKRTKAKRKIQQEKEEEEDDYFARELEKMGWGVGGFVDQMDDNDEERERAEAEWVQQNSSFPPQASAAFPPSSGHPQASAHPMAPPTGTPLAVVHGNWEGGPLAAEGWLGGRVD